MSRKVNIEVQYAVKGEHLPSKEQIENWALAALEGDSEVHAEIAVRLVGESESARLNQQYRSKVGPTNILSFPMDNPPGVDSGILGDLVICIPVVEREAREQSKDDLAHWAHMVVHGVMHLQGHDHQKEHEARSMESREAEIMKTLGFANPYT